MKIKVIIAGLGIAALAACGTSGTVSDNGVNAPATSSSKAAPKKQSTNDETYGDENHPVTVKVGKAFVVRKFHYAAGWKVSKDVLGDLDVTGLKVTNKRDDKDSALVTFKFWKGSEVLSSIDCSSDPIMPGTTVKLTCAALDNYPSVKYDKVTINDTF